MPVVLTSMIRNGKSIAPTTLDQRRGNGRLGFNWYRIKLTIPDRIGDYDPTGMTVVFETSLDDYAEIWVDGELSRALGPDQADRSSPAGMPRTIWSLGAT